MAHYRASLVTFRSESSTVISLDRITCPAGDPRNPAASRVSGPAH
jgi:hypothetical protein